MLKVEQSILLYKNYVKVFIQQFIGTLQICAPIFDVNFVLDMYGLQGVFWEIIFIELSNALLLRDATADPCALV